MGFGSAEATPRLTFQSHCSPGAVVRAAVTICRQHAAQVAGWVAFQMYQAPLNSQPSRMIEWPSRYDEITLPKRRQCELYAPCAHARRETPRTCSGSMATPKTLVYGVPRQRWYIHHGSTMSRQVALAE